MSEKHINKVVCPHCKYEHDELQEILSNNEREGSFDCWNCDKTILYEWDFMIETKKDTDWP